MLTTRLAIRSLASRSQAPASLFSSVATKAAEDDEDALSPVDDKTQKMSRTSKFMVFGKTGDPLPAPILPDDPKEIAALDPAQYVSAIMYC